MILKPRSPTGKETLHSAHTPDGHLVQDDCRVMVVRTI